MKFFSKKSIICFVLFIDFDEATAGRKRFDVANLLISTKRMGRIDDWISVKVMGALYKIWVVEADQKGGERADGIVVHMVDVDCASYMKQVSHCGMSNMSA